MRRLFRRLFRGLIVVIIAVAAAGFFSLYVLEDRAGKHHQSGIALLQAGDTDGAIAEFQRALEVTKKHKPTLEAYAGVLLDRGQLKEANALYLELDESYPEEVGAALGLARTAMEQYDPERAAQYAHAAMRLAPEDPRVIAVKAAVDYDAAIAAKDEPSAAAALAVARQVLAVTPNETVARRVVIDHLRKSPNPYDALPELDIAIAQKPNSYQFEVRRLSIFAKADDKVEFRKQVKRMHEKFPGNPDVRKWLFESLLAQGDNAGALKFLRGLAERDGGGPEAQLKVLDFIRKTEGPAAALAEISRLADTAGGMPQADDYRLMRAAINFQYGRAAEAIAELEHIDRRPNPPKQAVEIKLLLAQMQLAAGRISVAQELAGKILAADAASAEVIKMHTAWLIEGNKPDDALDAIFLTFGRSPRDPMALVLMASAYERKGATALARSSLARAVAVSGNAAEESLLYAQFLIRAGSTEDLGLILDDALQSSPENVALMAAGGELSRSAGGWTRKHALISRLREIGFAGAGSAAEKAEAAIILRLQRTAEISALLRELIGDNPINPAQGLDTLQDLVNSGKFGEASAVVESLLTATPRNGNLRLLSAHLQTLLGNKAMAEKLYRGLVAEAPVDSLPSLSLFGLLRREGRIAEASTVLDDALAGADDPRQLYWLKARHIEAEGDAAGAMRIYETLYAGGNANPFLANKLARMLIGDTAAPTNLKRAIELVTPFRTSNSPAFQDTYGWVMYLAGDFNEALSSLEAAAKGLENDALVRFHLGMAYAALKRHREARAALDKSLDLSGYSTQAQFTTARETLAALPPDN